jgi:hypothetical protein
VAKRITEGVAGKEDYSQTVMTYHIYGGKSSSEFWHNAPWLDFNMAQTWSAYTDIYSMLLKDYENPPSKPCGLGEGAYEDGPQYPTKPINDLVIRKQAFWSYFAAGYHTYGNGNVLHFDSFKAELTQPWKDALNSPGARQMVNLRKFFDSIGWAKFVPDQRLLPGHHPNGAHLNCAMRSTEDNALVFYLTTPGPIQIALGPLEGAPNLTRKWLNPATGAEKTVGAPKTGNVSLPAGWTDGLLWIKK